MIVLENVAWTPMKHCCHSVDKEAMQENFLFWLTSTLHNIYQNSEYGDDEHGVCVNIETVKIMKSLYGEIKDEECQDPYSDDWNDSTKNFNSFIAECHLWVSSFSCPSYSKRSNDKGQTISYQMSRITHDCQTAGQIPTGQLDNLWDEMRQLMRWFMGLDWLWFHHKNNT